MRIVAWNCNMALHRKFEALMALAPDIAVISECANPDRLLERGTPASFVGDPVWIGEKRDKGLSVFAFNGYSARLLEPYHRTLRYVAPVRISGPTPFDLLAVWAHNANAGSVRKHQLGPMRRALTKYRTLFADGPVLVAGDLNNNIFWDRPGWRMNHAHTVTALERHGVVSAYHVLRGEDQGAETEPTLYWRDRRKDGPTYHIDYIFVPANWIGRMTNLSVGGFEDWCGSGLSDHVPIVADVDI